MARWPRFPGSANHLFQTLRGAAQPAAPHLVRLSIVLVALLPGACWKYK